MLNILGTRPLPKWTVDSIINLGVAYLMAPLTTYIGFKYIVMEYVDYWFLLYFILMYTTAQFLLNALLFKLVKKQIPSCYNLIGIDYSDNSITLAKKVQQGHIEKEEDLDKEARS